MTTGTALLLATRLVGATGFRSGYEPLPDAPQVPLLSCTEIEWPELHAAVSRCSPNHSPLRIQVSYTPDGACLTVGPASTWVSTATTLGGLDVYSAQLNAGRRPDAITVFWGSGCGLASLHCSVVLALSDGATFTFWQLEAMGFGPAALLRLPDRAGVTLVHAVVAGGEGRDGRHHNYWVHTLFRIDGTTLRATDEEPIWIMYAFNENHVPTRQLSPSHKRAILADDNASPQLVRLAGGCGG